ncbi:MAG TPA: MCP four helix bundle domain-containing protein, partial [Syntrophorhabdaceae bacterium]|nr:MCP four helix bundle domain-containing protein [Syntrophorhabdaceae bacterium]
MIDIKRLSIKNRLQGGLGIIIALMVVLIVVGTFSLRNINAKLESIININNVKILLAQAVQTSVNEIDKNFLTLILVADELTTGERKEAIEKAAATYLASIEKLKKLETAKEV